MNKQSIVKINNKEEVMKLVDKQLGLVVKELADYKVVTTEGVDGTGEYALVNKKWGVVEASTPMLPQCLEYLEQLQAGLDARMHMGETAKATPKGDGEGAVDNVTSIH